MAKKGHRQPGKVPFVDLSLLPDEWDAAKDLRTRVRDSGKILPDNSDNVDIQTCVKCTDVLVPLLTRMSLHHERPVPQIDALRDAAQAILTKNKRSEDAANVAEIVSVGWQIRKLLVFIKMKVRRKEVSTAPRFKCCLKLFLHFGVDLSWYELPMLSGGGLPEPVLAGGWGPAGAI